VAASKCRLYVLLARDAPRAVIMRRGPSAQVMLALWHTDTDEVEEGQWIKGRIYERRADLSPDGTKLLYFAAQYRRREMPTWTAISTPPWWTAHVLWPKGDAWGGGGLWDSNTRVALNHPYEELKLDPSSRPPPQLKVREMGLRSRGGEDFPLVGMRLQRDGWRVVTKGGDSRPNFSESPVWKFDPAWEYARSRPKDRTLEVRMRILAIHERDGDWYVVEHRVVRVEGDEDEVVLDLGRTEWADWDQRGDLVYARGGVLLRVRPRGGRLGEPQEVIDLRDRTFVAREAPPSARQWRVKR
jgi:hypothetical protein